MYIVVLCVFSLDLCIGISAQTGCDLLQKDTRKMYTRTKIDVFFIRRAEHGVRIARKGVYIHVYISAGVLQCACVQQWLPENDPKWIPRGVALIKTRELCKARFASFARARVWYP